MAQPQLREDQWDRLYAVLRACPGIYVGREVATRRFVAAVLWDGAGAGCAWRLVPDAFGRWDRVLYQRFARWQEKGLLAGADRSSGGRRRSRVGHARQHRGASPRLRRRGKKSAGEQALGRSRGGFSTKLHAAADGPRQPARLPPDRRAAGRRAAGLALLLHRSAAQAVLADKAYDTDAILRAVAAEGALAVIPPRATRVHQRPTDWDLYQQRHKIENLFGFMKHYRRVFARFEKLARRYLAFVHLVAARILLR